MLMKAITVLLSALSPGATREIIVLPTQPAPSGMMSRYLAAQAFAALDRREAAFEKLKTQEQLAEYQAALKAFFIRQIGGLPERTPLNAQVVGRLERAGHRVEKIIFESRPGFFVTGLLFLPPGPGPHPAALVPCGHSNEGKGLDTYQRGAILLATHGIAAFLYDPIGQGERAQVLTEQGKARFSPVMEHTVVGVGSILVGTNTAGYRIWDGMRALDYLCSRDDIDSKRLGCTGNSGGGTLTSYLMALDERIVAAAPSCYLVGFRKLIETIGPQDAEQNIHAQIAGGMDHADYILMRAPRPTLLLCATQDFFDIRGAWDVYRQAKRLYGRLGRAEQVGLVENEGGHGWDKLLREGAVQWMRRWLMNVDGAVTEPPDLAVLTPEESQCTPKGQVLLLDGARTVFDFNTERAERFARERRVAWRDTPHDELRKRVRTTAGIRPLTELPEPSVQAVGAVERKGYRIERLIVSPEHGIALPAVAFVPPEPLADAYLYLHGAGKQTVAGKGGELEKLALAGHLVLAVDVRGIGETAGADPSKEMVAQFGPNWKDYFLAYMLERSFVGMRAEDIMVSARFLSGYRRGERHWAVHLVATGESAIPALHAVALEPALFATATLDEVPTWTQSLRSTAPGQLIQAVHGALQVYDLDDLRTLVPGAMLRKP